MWIRWRVMLARRTSVLRCLPSASTRRHSWQFYILTSAFPYSPSNVSRYDRYAICRTVLHSHRTGDGTLHVNSVWKRRCLCFHTHMHVRRHVTGFPTLPRAVLCYIPSPISHRPHPYRRTHRMKRVEWKLKISNQSHTFHRKFCTDARNVCQW